jgi:hypothetical protein
MGSGTRTSAFPGCAHRLLAVAVAAVCWLAVPSGASAQQVPGVDVSGLTSAATDAVAATGSTVETTVTAAAPVGGPTQDAVTQVAGTVGRITGPKGPVAGVGEGTSNATGSVVERVTKTAAPVADVVDRVAPEAQPTVKETLHNVTRAAPGAGSDSGSAGAPAGPRLPAVKRLSETRAAGADTSSASRLRLRGTAAPERPEAGLPTWGAERFSSVFTPLIPGPPIGLPGPPAGGGDTSSAAAPSGALELPSDTSPAAGIFGGSSAAGASVSFSLGGLALLLATLSLAGPALRRRLPRQPVMGWPAAFVPLLERPG